MSQPEAQLPLSLSQASPEAQLTALDQLPVESQV
jgi:hypothetical protein